MELSESRWVQFGGTRGGITRGGEMGRYGNGGFVGLSAGVREQMGE